MKLSERQKHLLRLNWGYKADTMACNVIVRLFDTAGPFECFLYAQNPDYHDEIKAILCGFTAEDCEISMTWLDGFFNSSGEPLKIDNAFRMINAATLLKKLKEKYEN